MNNVTSVRLYFLFALFLFLIGYQISHSSKLKIQQAHAQQAAQIERYTAAE